MKHAIVINFPAEQYLRIARAAACKDLAIEDYARLLVLWNTPPVDTELEALKDRIRSLETSLREVLVPK